MSEQRSAPVETSVIITIGLLITVSDWAIIMIGLGGLLLVIHLLFAAPVSVLSVGLQENK
jgi:hypothetical protein